ncbi:GNAT family N-acetyltransferase [Paenibacillus spongiae]|uniref:GNAT family N-acetyltransferase n=1 Tax=Paenibacillus spongiae TaxID=2909671 RepID=A0ABY5SL95_9BACL|nr:GNAT family N-acetyltransferase [Paenibacillus spongiae]UVI33348.1 GNAT family N-acetyltransferase [Paenibacillus spongiae]
MDEVSEWFWHDWGGGQSLDYMKYTTLHSAQRVRVPMLFITLADQRLVGTVSILMNDLRCRQDLYPWLTSLYVVEDMRNRGIGRLLQKRAIDEGRRAGYKNLYLITNHDGYYEKSGWIFKDLAPKMNGDFTRIYRKDLS